MVSDQLDDVPAGVMRVAGLGIPVVESERRLAGLVVAKELSALGKPLTRSRKAIAWHAQSEVIERLSTADRPELENRGPDPEHGTCRSTAIVRQAQFVGVEAP